MTTPQTATAHAVVNHKESVLQQQKESDEAKLIVCLAKLKEQRLQLSQREGHDDTENIISNPENVSFFTTAELASFKKVVAQYQPPPKMMFDEKEDENEDEAWLKREETKIDLSMKSLASTIVESIGLKVQDMAALLFRNQQLTWLSWRAVVDTLLTEPTNRVARSDLWLRRWFYVAVYRALSLYLVSSLPSSL